MRQIKRLLPFCSLLVVAHASALLAQGPPSEAEIDLAFRQLQQGFRVKAVASLGAESFDDEPEASAWLSKSFLARSVSDVFNRSNVRVRVEIDRRDLADPPTQPIRTSPMDCTPKRGCRSDCDGDCRRSTILGSYTDPFCFAGCLAEKAACEALKSSEKLGCEGVKALFAEKKVGEVSFSGMSAQGRGEVNGLTLGITDDLSRAQISGTLGASLSLRGSMLFRPEPLVQVGIVCLQMSGEVPGVQVSAPDQSLTLAANLNLQEEPDGISIDLSFDEVEPDVKVIGNPFIDFVLKNPLNFIQCSLPTFIGLLVDTFQGEFAIDQKIKIPGGKSFPVGAVAIFNGMTVTPRLTTTAVGLVERALPANIAAVEGNQAIRAVQGDLP